MSDEDIFQRCMFPDFLAEGAYLDFPKIKKLLRATVDERNLITPADLFTKVRQNVEQIYRWCLTKAEHLLVAGVALRHRSVTSPASAKTPKSQSDKPDPNVTDFSQLPLAEAAEALMYESLRFQEARNLNSDVVEWLLHQFSPERSLAPDPQWSGLLDGCNFMDIPLDGVFYCLSVVFETISGHQQNETEHNHAHEQEFVRNSIKYFVHVQDLPFVIARVVKHLPLSSFHDTFDELVTGAENPQSVDLKKPLQGKDPFAYRLGSTTSSIYYDNPDFLFYHRRLERLEGSSLIRMRWYGDGCGGLAPDDMKPPSSPREREHDVMNPTLSPKAKVFVEMKVHHEAWSGEASTKRRFNLYASEVDLFVHGQLSLKSKVEEMKQKGRSSQDIARFQELAADILGKIKAYGLHPALKTRYTRAAFQRGLDQTIRVSIDTNLRMEKEDFGAGKHWRYSGSSSMVSTYLPYAVVEVKLQCTETERIPAWVEELMWCRHMESVPKFSKYGHGIARLYGDSGRIKMEPYWLPQVEHVDLRAATKLDNRWMDLTQGIVKGPFEHVADQILLPGQREGQTRSTGGHKHQWLPTPNRRLYYNIGLLQGKILDKQGQLLLYSQKLNARHHVYTATKAKGAEDVVDDVETTAPGPAGIPWQTAKRIRVPQRFDPKTLLQSERYFLRWVSFGTHLSIGGLAMLHFGAGGAFPLDTTSSTLSVRGQLHTIIGTFLMASAFATLLYCLAVLNARSRRIYARQKLRYDDQTGPSILTMLLALAILVVGGSQIIVRYATALTGSEIW